MTLFDHDKLNTAVNEIIEEKTLGADMLGNWKNKYSESLSLSLHDQKILRTFVGAALARAHSTGVTDEDWKIANVARDGGVEISNVNKNLYTALWIEFLDVMRDSIPENFLKYHSLDEFVAAYPMVFSNCSDDEKLNLMNNANWMNILFKMEKAKKNKGLVMEVIPRLVEGPTARYVTGSGQTQATADRVHIYECEGGISPVVRGKRKKSRSSYDDSGNRDKKKSCTKQAQKKRKWALSLGSRRKVVARMDSYPDSFSPLVDIPQPQVPIADVYAKEEGEGEGDSVHERASTPVPTEPDTEAELDPSPATLPLPAESSATAAIQETQPKAHPQEPSGPSRGVSVGADNDYVTWSVDLNHFHGLGASERERRSSREKDRAESIGVDFTDGAEDSDEHEQADTASDLTNSADKCVELGEWADDDFTTLSKGREPDDPRGSQDQEAVVEYWDGLTLTRSVNGSDMNLCEGVDRDRVEDIPVLLRQPTDREALLELLGELGGPSNPASLEESLDPLIFSSGPALGSGVGDGARKRVPGMGGEKPPVMARMVSWGGPLPSCSQPLSLPGFPAPHSSFHSDFSRSFPDAHDGD